MPHCVRLASACRLSSALSFAHGLFEGRGPLNGYQPITLDVVGTHEDKLLRFFDHCPYYLKMKEEEVRMERGGGKGRVGRWGEKGGGIGRVERVRRGGWDGGWEDGERMVGR